MLKNKRKIADPTRRKILAAARQLFVEHGFSGVAMQAIADAAKVNQALLYHHFKNKPSLWQQVKIDFIEEISSTLPTLPEPGQGLRIVLEQLIEQRMTLYQHHPQLLRMMLWQQLESSDKKLFGGHNAAPDAWLPLLQTLQAKGEIRADLDLSLIMIWLASSITAPNYAPVTYFDPKKQQTAYKTMLVEAFYEILRPPPT